MGVVGSLPSETGAVLLSAARASFVDGMHVAAAIAAIVGVGLSLFAFVSLRDREVEEQPAAQPESVPEPATALAPVTVPTPARECF